jgi:hypothetical protein
MAGEAFARLDRGSLTACLFLLKEIKVREDLRIIQLKPP